MMNDDMDLLRDYAARQSEQAFATLVARHVHLVHSAALRQVRDPHLAGEITQTVFIILARKADSLGPKTILSGWLYRTAQFVSRAALKREFRRRLREQEAHMQAITDPDQTDSMWEQLSPFLDEAMAQLRDKDRDAIVLRYFENRSLKEIGGALGVEERAAQKRVARGLEKLRKFFIKRGIASTTTVIAGAISANSVQAAPIELARTISAVAIAKGAAASTSTLTLIKGALKIMAWTKMKTAVVAGVVLILAAGTTTVIVKSSVHHPKVKLQWTSAEIESFQQESAARINKSKQWALACIMFADDHGNKLPDNFEQLKTYASGLSSSNLEIVSRGNLTSFTKPDQTILLREKESRPSPDGKFAKVYAFADGQVKLIRSPDDDFAASEKQGRFSVQPAKN